MKKNITYLLISLFVFSCSKKEDDTATTTTATTTTTSGVIVVVPSSATELVVKITGNTEVLLNWKDNSTNETGFKIEREIGDSSYIQIGTIGSDSTSYADTGLVANTIYTYRVLAYNTIGNAAYSNEVMITVYPAVTIGNASWMQQNLDVDHYRNGDIIPQVTSPTEWASLTTGAWCYYKNNTANGPVYGKLYNWYAVNDVRGLAPKGWHIATNTEWSELTTFLGGETIAGGAMKATENWTSPNAGATNSSGFTAFGAGVRNNQGAFSNLGAWGVWWTADNDAGDISFYRILYNNSTKSEVYHNTNLFGLSVRCVRD